MQKPIPKFSDATPAVSQYLGEAVVVPIRRTMKGRGVIDRERAKFAEFADAFNRTGSALDAMLDMAERGKFLGVCLVDDQAMAMLRELIELFQRVYIGIALPKCAANRALWEKPSHKGPETKPYSEGGIIATVVGHNDDGATLVTQQGFHRATWGFLDAYCDEAYIGIPADWPAADRHFYRARFVIDQARQKVAA